MLNPFNILSKFIKTGNQKELNKIDKIVNQINILQKDMEILEDDQFPKKTIELREKIKKGISLDEVLSEAFALVREASNRVRSEKHFDVQLIGGVALHQNKIAEMKTGEGKTLTIALAAYLNALDNKGVHVVTVNDYLAKSGCDTMG